MGTMLVGFMAVGRAWLIGRQLHQFSFHPSDPQVTPSDTRLSHG